MPSPFRITIQDVVTAHPCRRCKAAALEFCLTAAGNRAKAAHKERYEDAADAGELDQFGLDFAAQWKGKTSGHT
jgi:hypothetical protein